VKTLLVNVSKILAFHYHYTENVKTLT